MKKKYILYPLIIIIYAVSIYLLSDILATYKLGLTDVYVSKVTLNERQIVKEEYLDIKRLPKVFVEDNVCLDKNDIVGKYVRLNTKVNKGSLFYKDSLDDYAQMKDNLMMDLKDNEVVYDLFIRDINVNPAYLLKDMHIDLYLTINRKEILSDLLISNARILNLYDINNKEIKDYDKDSSLGIISIAITKDMVPALNKAITIGEVSIITGSNLYNDDISKLNIDSKVYEYIK